MRLRYDKNAEANLANSDFLIKEFPVNLKENDVLEIGAGKGEMIAQLALQNSNITYYAFEKYPTVANKILKKINELNLKNLFIITKDASNLTELFTGKIDTIWLTFSDPWPKKAHEKRRLTYKTFLDQYKQLLSEKGCLYFKTDNDKLFEFSIESLNENNWNIIDMTTDLHSSKYNETNVQTGYEQKWSSLGKNINFLIAKPNK
ncbi:MULTISPECIES: tRNA (guanosine(46)-N7)-methyltransferase TrmB [unclassified Mycoplasma]|uniref:tRNA (guanosine(46)-N7)-methyltransferase TrmB n=1 Tax=unclassified Mycoplasma TaxID=2683645 RepID=UPI002B1DA416|nr:MULTISPECIES: tRNA (guanosine(46)-N7)-methyltransferase TrmB [unclassified Mycoplasma]MEA4134258.1 tRNA (guanosine(46)-N7)-methyltransferase TrmB [Mycoplasma sp. 2704]MEA4276085.1 tRNA (guanosine(46)-N7)-methyltransferase TrmB [Mycoplasma sp. 21DD0573]